MADSPPVPGTTEYKRLRQIQWVCVCTVLGLLTALLCVTAYVCVFRSVPLKISKETTYITGPLKSDGKQVDYFSAWELETYPRNMATEENGYRLLVQHLGMVPEPGATPARFAQLCEKLGLDAESIQPDMTLEDPTSHLIQFTEREGLEASLETLYEQLNMPWTSDNLPMMESWLAKNDAAIDLIVEAAGKSTFCIPLIRESEDDQLTDLPIPEVDHTRSYARALSARANYRIATGDIDGAIDDLIACKQLGRYVSRGGESMQLSVGIGIERFADSLGIASSRKHPPSKAQLERLINELDNLPPKGEFGKAQLFERYTVLHAMQTIASGKGTETVWNSMIDMPQKVGYDWNLVARRINQHFDGIIVLDDYPRLAWNSIAVVSMRARSAMIADQFVSLTYISFWGYEHELVRHSICADRMRRITLAMLLYERDHETLPPAFTVDEEGTPLHSWRVVLLPYLGQQELYNKIRLDEPWDSDDNRQFHKEAVVFYQCPSAELPPGQTTYAVVIGPDMPFEGADGKALSDLDSNGTDTILVIEQAEPGCWMNPRSNVEQADAKAGIGMGDRDAASLGSPHCDGVNLGYADGSVRLLREGDDSQPQ